MQDTDLLLHAFNLAPGPEPTNIKWENRHVTRQTQICNSIVVNFLVLCHLIAALALFTWMMHYAVSNSKKYPPTTDCEAVNSQFTIDGVVDYSELGNYYKFANIDFPYTVDK